LIARRSIAFAVPWPLLFQTVPKPGSAGALYCAETRIGFVRLPVEFRQRLWLHLQLHRGVLFLMALIPLRDIAKTQ
jgi:hypothetical protein